VFGTLSATSSFAPSRSGFSKPWAASSSRASAATNSLFFLPAASSRNRRRPWPIACSNRYTRISTSMGRESPSGLASEPPLPERRRRHRGAARECGCGALSGQGRWTPNGAFLRSGDGQALARTLRAPARSPLAMAHGELALHYQPQAKIDGECSALRPCSAGSTRSTGLYRQRPLSPCRAKRHDREIGEWTLRQACREAACWTAPCRSASTCRRCSSATATWRTGARDPARDGPGARPARA